MRTLLRYFKTEINPTDEQKIKIRKTIGTCRYIYNFYISHNKEVYEKEQKFLTAKAFSVWMNREYLPAHPEYQWIREVSSKAVKKSMENANIAFKRFFDKKSDFPRFKKKAKSDVKMYFVKNNPKDCICERHRIKVPSLGWVRIKEKGYIPTTKDNYVVRSGTISMEAGRYYISALVEIPKVTYEKPTSKGIGIDLGLKDFAIVSDGTIYKNINKTSKMKKLEKHLRKDRKSVV